MLLINTLTLQYVYKPYNKSTFNILININKELMMETETSTIKIVLRTRPTQNFANKNLKLDLPDNVSITSLYINVIYSRYT